MRCEICGKPCNPASSYQRVVGWEKPDRGISGRSGSSLVLREHVQEFAHPVCVAEQRAGTRGQGVLV